MNSPAGRRMTFAFVRPLAAVVLPAEAHLAIVLERHQPAVGDRDPMGVAGKVGQHLLRPGERRLGVDHPLPPALGREAGLEGAGLREPGKITKGPELALAMGLLETLEEEAPEQTREHPHRQEETRPAGDPAAAIEGDAAGRHDAVHVNAVETLHQKLEQLAATFQPPPTPTSGLKPTRGSAPSVNIMALEPPDRDAGPKGADRHLLSLPASATVPAAASSTSSTWSTSSRPRDAPAARGGTADYLCRMDFIVLDELGYLPFAQSGGQLLFHLINGLLHKGTKRDTRGSGKGADQATAREGRSPNKSRSFSSRANAIATSS